MTVWRPIHDRRPAGQRQKSAEESADLVQAFCNGQHSIKLFGEHAFAEHEMFHPSDRSDRDEALIPRMRGRLGRGPFHQPRSLDALDFEWIERTP